MRDDIDPAEVRRMRDQNLSWNKIAQFFSARPSTVRRRVDPAYASQSLVEGQTSRASMRAKRDVVPEPEAEPVNSPPRDTRDFTARLFGDPLPGRSALDRMKLNAR